MVYLLLKQTPKDWYNGPLNDIAGQKVNAKQPLHNWPLRAYLYNHLLRGLQNNQNNSRPKVTLKQRIDVLSILQWFSSLDCWQFIWFNGRRSLPGWRSWQQPQEEGYGAWRQWQLARQNARCAPQSRRKSSCHTGLNFAKTKATQPPPL